MNEPASRRYQAADSGSSSGDARRHGSAFGGGAFPRTAGLLQFRSRRCRGDCRNHLAGADLRRLFRFEAGGAGPGTQVRRPRRGARLFGGGGHFRIQRLRLAASPSAELPGTAALRLCLCRGGSTDQSAGMVGALSHHGGLCLCRARTRGGADVRRLLEELGNALRCRFGRHVPTSLNLLAKYLWLVSFPSSSSGCGITVLAGMLCGGLAAGIAKIARR